MRLRVALCDQIAQIRRLDEQAAAMAAAGARAHTTVAQGHTDFDPTVETPEPLAHRLRAACGRARSNDDPALTRATQAKREFCRSYL